MTDEISVSYDDILFSKTSRIDSIDLKNPQHLSPDYVTREEFKKSEIRFSDSYFSGASNKTEPELPSTVLSRDLKKSTLKLSTIIFPDDLKKSKPKLSTSFFSEDSLNTSPKIVETEESEEETEEEEEDSLDSTTFAPEEPESEEGCKKRGDNPVDYLDKELFPMLLPCLEQMLFAAKENKVLKVQKSHFNGLDYLAELLWNRNPLHPERLTTHVPIFEIPFVKTFLEESPRPVFPQSWLWSKNQAAVVIQAAVRGYLVRSMPEVQELRQFWKTLAEEKQAAGDVAAENDIYSSTYSFSN